MVGAEDGDQQLEAALALVEVIGDVGGEVGLLAVGAHHDAVFLVAEGSRAEPGGAVLLEGMAVGAQPLQRAVDRSAVRAVAEVAFGVPAVEADAELGQVVADVGEDRRESLVEHGLEVRRAEQRLRARDNGVYIGVFVAALGLVGRQPGEHLGRGTAQRLAAARAQRRRDRAQVIPAIAVRRELETLAAELEIAQPHRRSQDLHLAAGVVHVVLAVHAPAVGLQQVRDRRAERRVAAVADVQRPGRVGRDELDDGGPAAPAVAAPVGRARRVHARDLALPGGGRQEEVDESRPRDLGPGDQLVRR